jgi:hypothetical protein
MGLTLTFSAREAQSFCYYRQTTDMHDRIMALCTLCDGAIKKQKTKNNHWFKVYCMHDCMGVRLMFITWIAWCECCTAVGWM